MSYSLPTPSAEPLTARSSIGTIAATWLAHFGAQVHHKDRQAKTKTNYLQSLAHLGPLAEVALADLTVPQICAWHREIYAQRTSAVAYLAYTTLRAVCGWARRQGLLPYNVAAAIGITHRSQPTTPVKPDQVAQLRTAIDTLLVERDGWAQRRGRIGFAAVAYRSGLVALQLAVLTGRRPSEVCGLRVDCIDLLTGTIALPVTKTGPSVVVLAADSLALVQEQLLALKGRSSFLFPSPVSPNSPITRHCMWEQFQRACVLARISKRQLRGLRNGWAWAALFAGASLEDTGRALGHRDVKTTQRSYGGGVYVTFGMLRAAASVDALRRRAA